MTSKTFEALLTEMQEQRIRADKAEADSKEVVGVLNTLVGGLEKNGLVMAPSAPEALVLALQRARKLLQQKGLEE